MNFASEIEQTVIENQMHKRLALVPIAASSPKRARTEVITLLSSPTPEFVNLVSSPIVCSSDEARRRSRSDSPLGHASGSLDAIKRNLILLEFKMARQM